MKNLIPLFTFCLLFSCCAKKYKATEMPLEKLTFGTGGGFSGYTTEHTLLKNGQLFEKKDPNPETVELTAITKQRAKSIFTRCEHLKLSTMEFDHPDNFYYYIDITTKDVNNRITWGDSMHPIPEEIKHFFKQLKGMSAGNQNNIQ